MHTRQPIPDLWLLSDERNDATLEQALARLPVGSGFVFRHYHLADAMRRKRFEALAAIARAGGHRIILSGDPELALQWGAEGIYGVPAMLGERSCGLLRLASAHDAEEVEQANRAHADAVMISPVFQTRSHPGKGYLGIGRFRELAAQAQMPVIALGGMTAERARAVGSRRWAAIDGLA